MSFSNMLKTAMNINDNTSPEAIAQEKSKVTSDTGVTPMDNSEFLYPTLIIIPMVIVLISILTLSVSVIAKLILFVLLLFSLVVYVLQYKRYNITKPLLKISNNINKNLNLDKNMKMSSGLSGFKD